MGTWSRINATLAKSKIHAWERDSRAGAEKLLLLEAVTMGRTSNCGTGREV